MNSTLLEEHFEDFFDEKKCIFINVSQTWSEKIPTVCQKLFDGVLKTAFHASIGTFCAKIFLEKTFFNLFRTLSETLLASFRKFFGQIVETAIYVSIRIFWGNRFFENI